MGRGVLACAALRAARPALLLVPPPPELPPVHPALHGGQWPAAADHGRPLLGGLARRAGVALHISLRLLQHSFV